MNKYGLSRAIPAQIKREVRQRCGFGCVVCGAGIIQYEHVEPEFHEAESHDADKIALLCPQCHAKVTTRIWSKDKIKQAMRNPICKKKGFTKEAFDLGEGPLGNILGSLAIYQLVISSHGYFIRGGIEAGYNYIDEKIVFGDALITAYNLESKLAVFPRVLVGPELKSLIERQKKWYPNINKMPHNDVLNLASTDLFIDYLKGSLSFCEDDYKSIYPLVEKHKVNIEKELKQHQSNSKVLQKYIWLKDYHNNFCNSESAFKNLLVL